MNPIDTGSAYDQIADNWRSDRFDNNNGIAAHERALTFLETGSKALDVGCGGNPRLRRLLLAAGFAVDAIDVSAQMLALAAREEPRANYIQADVCRWTFPVRYDFISAWDSIWHVPLAQQEAVLARLLRNLQPGGVLIFSAGGTLTAGEIRNTFMGPEVYYATLGVPGFLAVIAAQECLCRHLEFDQHPEEHVYFIAQRPAETV